LQLDPGPDGVRVWGRGVCEVETAIFGPKPKVPGVAQDRPSLVLVGVGSNGADCIYGYHGCGRRPTERASYPKLHSAPRRGLQVSDCDRETAVGCECHIVKSIRAGFPTRFSTHVLSILIFMRQQQAMVSPQGGPVCLDGQSGFLTSAGGIELQQNADHATSQALDSER